MNIDVLLKPEIQDFIDSNLNANVKELAFKKNTFSEIDYTVLLNQIIAKQKAKEKLPTWFATKSIIYPEKISIEQTSSEKTAAYKSSLINGDRLIDLSGGFGIDAFYFAKNFKKVIHCEMNTDLSKVVKHNFSILNIDNIQCESNESTLILEKLNDFFDWIYVDPSRRHDFKGKVFLLKDCEPNVPELLPFYFKFSKNILVKTAPILDIQSGISELKNVKKIHIVALENEVKELLWEIEKDYADSIQLNTVNIDKNLIHHDSTILNKEYICKYSLPKKFLYEPNASLMKSGQFKYISEKYSLEKLQQHSHLYTSNDLINFPGRRFEISSVLPFQKDVLKKHILNQKLNVSTRNFPLKVDEIKKKYKIKDGGTIFAFFTTDLNNNKIILLCNKTEQ